MLEQSRFIESANFTTLAEIDLRRLYGVYDSMFFNGLLDRAIRDDRASIRFRLSSRMTRNAGTTTQYRLNVPGLRGADRPISYEIAVATTLLFNTFREGAREVTVGGLVCHNRLEALQRIFEHELLHLAEFLGWGESSCTAPNFHRLSRRIFGHEGVRHDLITPRELAAEVHGIHVGDRVNFEFDGVRRTGRVNRITKRATVLVDDPNGRPYSDGKTYATFYVPLPWLRKEAGP